MPPDHRSQAKDIARCLFSAQVAAQLAACQSCEALLASDDRTALLDRLRQASVALGSLSDRLLKLAAQGSSSEQQTVAKCMWRLLDECCRRPQSQLLPELLQSGRLQAALKAGLQDLEQCSDGPCPQAAAMLLLKSLMTLVTPDQRPKWLSSFLPAAVRVLEVCPVTRVGAVHAALEVIWRHVARPGPHPLLQRIVAAVLDRQLHLHRPYVGHVAARVLGAAASKQFGEPALRARIWKVDLSAVVREAERWPSSSAVETGNVHMSMLLAGHPDFQVI